MLAGLIVPQLRLDYALASIFCEHCSSLRNNPHYAPRHIMVYYAPRRIYRVITRRAIMLAGDEAEA